MPLCKIPLTDTWKSCICKRASMGISFEAITFDSNLQWGLEWQLCICLETNAKQNAATQLGLALLLPPHPSFPSVSINWKRISPGKNSGNRNTSPNARAAADVSAQQTTCEVNTHTHTPVLTRLLFDRRNAARFQPAWSEAKQKALVHMGRVWKITKCQA